MAAETHACATDTAIAVGMGKEVINRLDDILVVGVKRLHSCQHPALLSWSLLTWLDDGTECWGS